MVCPQQLKARCQKKGLKVHCAGLNMTTLTHALRNAFQAATAPPAPVQPAVESYRSKNAAQRQIVQQGESAEFSEGEVEIRTVKQKESKKGENKKERIYPDLSDLINWE